MHQEFDDDLCHINKNFSRGDIVELDAGMPELEQIVGFGIVLAAGRADGLAEDEVVVHWQTDVWQDSRNQKMQRAEIRHVTLL